MRTNRRIGAGADQTFTESARRAQIVDCAIAVVSRHGYAGASLSRVAELAGISKGVITYHFASKAEILEAVVAEVFARGAAYARANWPDGFTEDSEPRQMLRAYLESNLAYIAAHPEQVNAVVEIARGHRDSAGSLVFGSDWEEREVFGLLEEVFRAGQQSGQFREFSPRVMAVAVRRVIDGFTYQVLAHPETDTDAFIREVVELFDRATRREDPA
jgi:AcrR family transcriptional regulator